MLFVPHVLEFSSILHVALLVFLRLISVLKPYQEETSINNLRRISIASIWILSVAFCVLPIISLTLKMKVVSTYVRLLTLHCFNTIPVVGIIIMWCMLMWVAKKKQVNDRQSYHRQSCDNSNPGSYDKRSAVIVRRLVIILLVCYLPYLAWKEYFYGIIFQRSCNELTPKVNMVYNFLLILLGNFKSNQF